MFDAIKPSYGRSVRPRIPKKTSAGGKPFPSPTVLTRG